MGFSCRGKNTCDFAEKKPLGMVLQLIGAEFITGSSHISEGHFKTG